MKKLTTGLISCLLLATSVPALADRGERHFRPDHHGRHFDSRPRYYGKQLHHRYPQERYGYGPGVGALGLGLAVGSVMFALEAPRPPRVVVQVAPPPVRPSERMWYYCESAQTYYPYVQFCQEGWRAVPAY